MIADALYAQQLLTDTGFTRVPGIRGMSVEVDQQGAGVHSRWENRRKLVILKSLIVAAVLTAALGTAHAADDDWIGFYVGIDELDGSHNQVSVPPNDDGTYSVRVKASKFCSCESAAPVAVLIGTGRIDVSQLRVEGPELWCTGRDGAGTTLGDLSFTLDAETDVPSYQSPLDGRTLSFHKFGGR